MKKDVNTLFPNGFFYFAIQGKIGIINSAFAKTLFYRNPTPK